MNTLVRQSKRTMPVACCFVAIVLVIIARLFFLQCIKQEECNAKSYKNFFRTESIDPLRGVIYDRCGKALATNKPIFQLYWQPTGNKVLSVAQKKLFEQLCAHPHLHIKHISIDLLARAERTYQPFLLQDALSFDQVSVIMEQFSNQENIHIFQKSRRYYPYATAACHILGYLHKSARSDLLGASGLERICQQALQGQVGTLVKTVCANGKIVSNTILEKESCGKDIHTTIDIELQQAAENAFPCQWRGSCIVMNPANGDILAMLSRPLFDPALFMQSISVNNWQTLQDTYAFLNRALEVPYPPGSIFKLVTTAAALECNIITQDTVVCCTGATQLGSELFACARNKSHGAVTCLKALAQSCNPFFFEIGKAINVEHLADYAHRFGLGTKTGICLQEHSGLIPTKQWKYETYGEQWWLGETLLMTIGQSYLLVTPLQVACMIGSIFTGFLVKPRIVMEDPVVLTPLAIQETTRTFLQESMHLVVKKGTGRAINDLKDFDIYAKTSTAQTSKLEKRKRGGRYLEHGWFVTYFSYPGQDPLVCVVLVEHAGSTRKPAKIVKDFLIGYSKLKS